MLHDRKKKKKKAKNRERERQLGFIFLSWNWYKLVGMGEIQVRSVLLIGDKRIKNALVVFGERFLRNQMCLECVQRPFFKE